MYYLVITDVEKGILSIRYNTKELKWYKRDDKGDHYLRPFDAKGVGIESWSVFLPLDDIARDLIREQIVSRKDRFLKALTNNAVEVLPRLQGEAKTLKCKSCPFKAKCFDEDLETLDAVNWDIEQQRSDLLKMDGVVELFSSNNSNIDNTR